MYSGSKVIDSFDHNEDLANYNCIDNYSFYKNKNFLEIRKMMNHVINKNIFIRQDIADIINNFYQNSFDKEAHTISVYIENPVETNDQYSPHFNKYFNKISKITESLKSNKWQIFLTTNDEYFTNKFVEHYGNKVIYRKVHSDKNIKELLSDSYLLAKGKYFVTTVSDITSYTSFLNPKIELNIIKN